jgi:hypothetical protein
MSSVLIVVQIRVYAVQLTVCTVQLTVCAVQLIVCAVQLLVCAAQLPENTLKFLGNTVEFAENAEAFLEYAVGEETELCFPNCRFNSEFTKRSYTKYLRVRNMFTDLLSFYSRYH